jgi:hypothetical protein
MHDSARHFAGLLHVAERCSELMIRARVAGLPNGISVLVNYASTYSGRLHL